VQMSESACPAEDPTSTHCDNRAAMKPVNVSR
jgi:hypothetical protein